MALTGTEPGSCYLDRNFFACNFMRAPESHGETVVGWSVMEPKDNNPETDAEKPATPAAEATAGETPIVEAEDPVAGLDAVRVNQRRFGQMSRRELLKVAPVLALGAFAIPSFQDSLLKKGLAFSDWASVALVPPRPPGPHVRGFRPDAL